MGELPERKLSQETNAKKCSLETDPFLLGEIKQSTKDWQDFMTEEEAKYIEDRLQDYMTHLGYSNYTSK